MSYISATAEIIYAPLLLRFVVIGDQNTMRQFSLHLGRYRRASTLSGGSRSCQRKSLSASADRPCMRLAKHIGQSGISLLGFFLLITARGFCHGYRQAD